MLRARRWWWSLGCPQVTFPLVPGGGTAGCAILEQRFQEQRTRLRRCPVGKGHSQTAGPGQSQPEVRPGGAAGAPGLELRLSRAGNAGACSREVLAGRVTELEPRTLDEQLHAAFTRHQPLKLLQAPAEQLAPMTQLVTEASGYPAGQERPAKSSPPCLPLLLSWLSPAQERSSSLGPAWQITADELHYSYCCCL